jgi:Sulfotransferase domain
MQVIGAGLGGTGTLQLKAALELLGFGPCYHIAEVQKHPEQIGLWGRVADGEAPDWDALFGTYESCVDFPACVLYAELMDAYPEAKVVLTIRDPERAYDRVRDTIYKLTTEPDSPLPTELHEAFGALVWDRVFNGSFENRPEAIEVYRHWNDEVQTRVPSDRLLVYDADDGWEPLCRFLGRDVPTEPFPS